MEQKCDQLQAALSATVEQRDRLLVALKGAWKDGYCFHGPEGYTTAQQEAADAIAAVEQQLAKVESEGGEA